VLHAPQTLYRVTQLHQQSMRDDAQRRRRASSCSRGDGSTHSAGCAGGIRERLVAAMTGHGRHAGRHDYLRAVGHRSDGLAPGRVI
jgi:hypothetical protein